MDINEKKIIEQHNGHEFFYKDYGVVGISGFNIIRGGEIVEKITDENIEEILSDLRFDEYGTTDINIILKTEGLI